MCYTKSSLCGAGGRTQGLTHIGLALYQQSYSPSLGMHFIKGVGLHNSKAVVVCLREAK